MKFLRHAVPAALLAAACSFAHAAAAPVAGSLTSGFTFEEYSGSAAVGHGYVDTRDTLYYIDEQVVDGVKSWYIFFDPKGGETVDATLTFGGPILGVLTTKGELDASNATYGIDVDHDGVFDDYTTSHYIGLEGQDYVSWASGSNSLTIHFAAIDPGDHIRVLVSAVPEPSTYAMFGAGLLAMGFAAKRRRRD